MPVQRKSRNEVGSLTKDPIKKLMRKDPIKLTKKVDQGKEEEKRERLNNNNTNRIDDILSLA